MPRAVLPALWQAPSLELDGAGGLLALQPDPWRKSEEGDA